MKKGIARFIFYISLGATIFTAAESISKWHKIAPHKEAFMILTALACSSFALLLQFKFKNYLGPQPDLASPPASSANFYERHPVLARYISTLIGLAIGLTVYLLLTNK